MKFWGWRFLFFRLYILELASGGSKCKGERSSSTNKNKKKVRNEKWKIHLCLLGLLRVEMSRLENFAVEIVGASSEKCEKEKKKQQRQNIIKISTSISNSPRLILEKKRIIQSCRCHFTRTAEKLTHITTLHALIPSRPHSQRISSPPSHFCKTFI